MALKLNPGVIAARWPRPHQAATPSRLAARGGFALPFPEQQRGNLAAAASLPNRRRHPFAQIIRIGSRHSSECRLAFAAARHWLG